VYAVFPSAACGKLEALQFEQDQPSGFRLDAAAHRSFNYERQLAVVVANLKDLDVLLNEADEEFGSSPRVANYVATRAVNNVLCLSAGLCLIFGHNDQVTNGGTVDGGFHMVAADLLDSGVSLVRSLGRISVFRGVNSHTCREERTFERFERSGLIGSVRGSRICDPPGAAARRDWPLVATPGSAALAS